MAHVQEASDAGTLRFQLRGVQFKNTEGFGFLNKSDPFFELMRRRVSAKTGETGPVWDSVFRSPHVDNDLNPVWPEHHMEVDALCGGRRDQPFRN